MTGRSAQVADQWRGWLSATPDPLLEVLDGVAQESSLPPANGPWRRTYARLESNAAEPGGLSGVLVYERGQGSGARAILVECRTGTAPVVGAPVGLSLPWGFVRALPFAQDPELPTLAGVLAANPTAQVLRYRPHHRCTMRVDAEGTRFLKVFHDGRGSRLYEEGVALWHAATSGELTFGVAEPLGWDPDARTLSMGPVAGEPVMERLRAPGGAGLAELMGRSCAELTVSGLAPTQSFNGKDQVERSGRYAKRLSLLVPHLEEQVRDLLEDLAKIHSRLGGRVLKPIHGAPHVHQWLVDGERIGLVDFDRYCLGDPELDAATFVAEMDSENPANVPRAILSDAFLRGYADVAGPLEPQLLAAYRAHKWLAKAEKTARKPLVDASERAARHLQAARRMILDAD